jgi:hypothetical protein
VEVGEKEFVLRALRCNCLEVDRNLERASARSGRYTPQALHTHMLTPSRIFNWPWSPIVVIYESIATDVPFDKLLGALRLADRRAEQLTTKQKAELRSNPTSAFAALNI